MSDQIKWVTHEYVGPCFAMFNDASCYACDLNGNWYRIPHSLAPRFGKLVCDQHDDPSDNSIEVEFGKMRINNEPRQEEK